MNVRTGYECRSPKDSPTDGFENSAELIVKQAELSSLI